MNTEITPKRRVSKRTLEIENEEFRLVNAELEDQLSRSRSREATLREQVQQLKADNSVLADRLNEELTKRESIEATLERLLSDIEKGKILKGRL